MLQKENNSIFQKIETLINTTGELPDDFEAEEREYGENELRFAPGAMEGILGHHSLGKGEIKDFADTLKSYLEMDSASALEQFEETQPFQVACGRNELLQEIISHQEEYPADKVANLGYYFACQGSKCESVKLGLSLLALFDFSDNEQVCGLLRYLGYCEEFTDYVTMSVAGWEESKKQDFYFELAKKLKGWGKIDIVEEMNADTPEKKEWILCHGCKNSIMNSYLAYECVQKCDFHDRLREGNLIMEQLKGAGEIMIGLIEEGPCKGMSIVEEPVELTLNYINEVMKHPLDVVDIQHLCWIHEYFDKSEIENGKQVCERLQQTWTTMDLSGLVTENLAENPHACVQIANHFELDIAKPLLELMRQDLKKYFNYSFYFFRKDCYVDEFLDLCERETDESLYPKKMGDSLGIGRMGEGMLALDMVVQYMDKYPLKGRKLLVISIQSPITRWRNMAAKVLNGWTQKLEKPLSEIDTDLYELVKEVAAKECNETTKEAWNKLL